MIGRRISWVTALLVRMRNAGPGRKSEWLCAGGGSLTDGRARFFVAIGSGGGAGAGGAWRGRGHVAAEQRWGQSRQTGGVSPSWGGASGRWGVLGWGGALL